jgi:hypothetical protein
VNRYPPRNVALSLPKSRKAPRGETVTCMRKRCMLRLSKPDRHTHSTASTREPLSVDHQLPVHNVTAPARRNVSDSGFGSTEISSRSLRTRYASRHTAEGSSVVHDNGSRRLKRRSLIHGRCSSRVKIKHEYPTSEAEFSKSPTEDLPLVRSAA